MCWGLGQGGGGAGSIPEHLSGCSESWPVNGSCRVPHARWWVTEQGSTEMRETGSVTVLAPVLGGTDLLLELFLISCVTLNAQSSWGFLSSGWEAVPASHCLSHHQEYTHYTYCLVLCVLVTPGSYSSFLPAAQRLWLTVMCCGFHLEHIIILYSSGM